MSTAQLADLPPMHAWLLLMTLHQRKPAKLTATQALDAVGGADPVDLVVLAQHGWIAGYRHGQQVNLAGDDDQINQGLRELELRVTDTGNRWVQTSPYNLIISGVSRRDHRTGAPLYNIIRESGAGPDLVYVAKLARDGYARVVDARGEKIDPAQVVGYTTADDLRRVGLTARGRRIATAS